MRKMLVSEAMKDTIAMPSIIPMAAVKLSMAVSMDMYRGRPVELLALIFR
jgi:hypothetical protein